jgi:hypothetical protein
MRIFLELLELLGLLVAALEFFDITPKIQDWIDKWRKKFFQWLKGKGNERIAYNKTFVRIMSLVSFTLFAWLWYSIYTHSPMAISLYVWWAIIVGGPLLTLFILLPLLYDLLVIINRAPSKTVGFFSFGLALLSWGLQWWWHSGHPCG